MISVLHCLAFYESDSTKGSLVLFSGVHWRGKEKKEEISTWAKKLIEQKTQRNQPAEAISGRKKIANLVSS